MMPKAKVFCSLLFFAVLSWSVAQSEDKPAEAMVFNIKGDWHIAGQHEALRAGEVVPLGVKLTTEWFRLDNEITILLFQDGRKLYCHCQDKPNPCIQGFLIPDMQSEKKGTIAAIIEAVRRALLEESPRSGTSYSNAISRGNTTALVEAVLPLQSHTADLTQVFPNLQPGRYNLKLLSLDGKQIQRPSTLDWNSNGQKIEVNLPRSSVYKANLSRDNDIIADAMFLAADHDHYTTAKRSFANAQQIVDSWPAEPGQFTSHEFLRYYLISQAKPQ